MSEDKNTKKQYWKGLEEYQGDPGFEKSKHNEFAENLPIEKIFEDEQLKLSSNRRDFLKFFGFSLSAATLAACTETPVRKAIPYVIQPEVIKPGIPNYYATTLGSGTEFYSVIVKTREGRPIKIEGNKEAPLGQGGTCAVGQASVLSLYDQGRLTSPTKNKKAASWAEVDDVIISRLKNIQNKNGQIRILSGTLNSPSTLKTIEQFKETYPNTKHVSYDAVSSWAILEANKKSFNKPVIPDYHFDKASVIVSFGADFLGTWISPVNFTKQYSRKRKLRGESELKLSHHIQFESCMSLTGSNADLRATLKPSQEGIAVASLYNQIARLAGKSQIRDANFDLAGNSIEHAASQLWKNRGQSLVVCGSNNTDVQILVNAINDMLGNYGKTIDIDNPSYQKTGNDIEMQELISEMKQGQVDCLIIYGTNPSYTYPDAEGFNEGLKQTGTTISFAERLDETARLCEFVCPDHHYLESWNDYQPKANLFSLSQPTIAPIFNTRAAQESLLSWTGETINYYDNIRSFWQENVYTLQNQDNNFNSFWNKSLHDGFFQAEQVPSKRHEVQTDAVAIANGLVSSYSESDELEIVLYEKTGIRDGQCANNPWLQELPDPITKACWDNYACLSPKFAKEHGIKQEDVIKITSNGKTIELPVLLQPGQAYNTIGIAVGYGHDMEADAAKVANKLGKNAYPFAVNTDGNILFGGATASIEKTGKKYRIAQTQTHHHLEGRDIVRETSLQEIIKDPKGAGTKPPYPDHSLYSEWKYKTHHWGMAIDLSACTGCGSCVVSCQAENNVPVVGKEEVLRRREMHWIRIDRYYDGNPEEESPAVVFQPMLCQHCDQAPCENVCPVAAISHSSEGLNQQIYNRCVGTRYCANNCPYKVRRFNWFNYVNNEKFDYNMNNPLGRMVLNPDVTVRSRGVMEKCTFCVQDLQAAKLNAKKENRALRDGDAQTACQKACPADAIVFGDMNDKNSEVRKLMDENRAYQVLEIIDVRPSIRYLPKIRNNEHKA